jgi:tRNA nucleotidyltransferase/poly(A) polymerase
VRLAASLDFRIDLGTRRLIKDAAELLPNTSAERQRDELFRILSGPRSDACLRALDMLGALAYVLPEVSALKGIQQGPPHVHDVWEHTLAMLRHVGELTRSLLGEESAHGGDLFAGLLKISLGRFQVQLARHFAEALNQERTVFGLLSLAALYHDVGKAGSRTVDSTGQIHFSGHERQSAQLAVGVARRWNLANDEVERLRLIVQNHMRIFDLAFRQETAGEGPSRRAIYRFFRDAGTAAVDVILLGLADLRGTRGQTLTEAAWRAWIEVARALFENLWERPEESVTPPALVNGNEIMRELGLPAGPDVGMLLDAIREAQAAGEIRDAEGAVEFGRVWLSTRGHPAR